MVILHVKKGDESQFLFETSVEASMEEVTKEVAIVYNGRLKISRLCYEMEELSKHGTMYPPNILGLYEDQVKELGLVDEWGEICIPSGGWVENKDPVGRRNGRAPSSNMADVLQRTVEEAKGIVSKKQVECGTCMSQKKVQEALDILRGAVMIVYPMNLPPHDPVRQELDNTEDLGGTQASLDVIDIALAQLWFSGKELRKGKKLKDFIGPNQKTKITVKITSSGQGAPSREPLMSEQERKELMLREYRRQQELKRLEQDDSDECFNAPWADSGNLKRAFQGLNNISWRPK